MNLEGLAGVPVETIYERAYEAHWNDVFRFALAWTNDWGAAEDVAQDAFAQLWRHRATLDWDRPVLPWLIVIARRLTTDRFRRVRRLLFGAPRPATLDEVTADRWLDVQRAMTVLSPLERTALVLTLVEGHDYAQVATILTTSPGAVRSAVSRAREKLEAVR